MKSAIALLFVASASCAPKAIPVEPIAPLAIRVSEAAKVTTQRAEKITLAADAAKQDADETAHIAKRGTTEAQRLSRSGKATTAELEENARLWEEAWAAAQRAVIRADALKLDAKELESAAKRTSNESAKMEIEAVKTDKATEALKTEIVKQTENAALGKALKRLLWIAIGFFLLGILLWTIIKLAPIVIQAAKPL
jgi:thiol:disulfide interchange protein